MQGRMEIGIKEISLVIESFVYSQAMLAFPNAKINLGLHILNKRSDGYHDIETVFYPVPWCDVLEIIPDKKKQDRKVSVPFEVNS